jgi:hypothetical protein
VDYPWLMRAYLTWSPADLLKLDTLFLPMGSALGTGTWEQILGLLRTLYGVALGALGLSLAAQWRRGFCRTTDAMVLLATLLYLRSSSVGPYFLAIILTLLLARREAIWHRPSTWLLLLACLPLDVPLFQGHTLETFSWVSNAPVAYELNLNLGHLLRPILFPLFATAFAAELWLAARGEPKNILY